MGQAIIFGTVYGLSRFGKSCSRNPCSFTSLTVRRYQSLASATKFKPGHLSTIVCLSRCRAGVVSDRNLVNWSFYCSFLNFEGFTTKGLDWKYQGL